MNGNDMTDKFIASNGIGIEVNDNEQIIFDVPNRPTSPVWMRSVEIDALREYVIAEEDKRLGRWRWPENPDYVVYPNDATSRLRIVRESDGYVALVYNPENESGGFKAAAIAYDDAHAEPKPWYDAQNGEVWILVTPATGERPYQVVRTEDDGFRFFLIGGYEGFRPGLFPQEAQIKAGRRIWPTE